MQTLSCAAQHHTLTPAILRQPRLTLKLVTFPPPSGSSQASPFAAPFLLLFRIRRFRLTIRFEFHLTDSFCCPTLKPQQRKGGTARNWIDSTAAADLG